MAKLIYGTITSLDGYIADANGNFDWAEPDEDVHTFVNDLERSIGTYLYGRRMYEVMTYWETAVDSGEHPSYSQDYAHIWQATDKVVYSKTLDEVSSTRTRIEREFRPEDVREMKESASHDLSVGGADLAAQALRAGLVDEIHLSVAPMLVGGGNPALPAGFRQPLELLDERPFGKGMLHLHYRLITTTPTSRAGALPVPG